MRVFSFLFLLIFFSALDSGRVYAVQLNKDDCKAKLDSLLPNDTLISPDDLIYDFNYLIETIDRIHPDIYANSSKILIDSLVSDVKKQITKSLTKLEFAKLVIPVIAALNDGHTSFLWPYEYWGNYLENEGVIFPFSVLIREERLFIRSNYSADTTLTANAEILSINGHHSLQVINTMKKYVSSELEHFRNVQIERNFNTLLWFLFPYCENDFFLEVKESDFLRSVYVKGNSLAELRKRSSASAQNKAYYYYSINNEDTPVGIIVFNSMRGTKEFQKFLKSTFSEIKSNGIQNLVIDIRNNGGGNSQLADKLFNYISSEPYRMVDIMEVKLSPEAKTTFKKVVPRALKPLLYTIGPFHPISKPYLFTKNGEIHTYKPNKLNKPKRNKLAFEGNTFLLTSHYTFSSAFMLTAAFKCYGMGLVVGQETGGVYDAFGDIVRFLLPNSKMYAASSHKRFVHPCYNGVNTGVIPHVDITPTIDDIRNKRDLAIDYVIQSIK